MQSKRGADALASIAALRRRTGEDVEASVAATISDVARRGDAALLEAARRFDAPDLASLRVTPEELDAATLPRRQFEAIRTAIHRIRRFHLTQLEVMLGGMFDFSTAGIADLLELGEPRPGFAARWAMGRRPSAQLGRSPLSREFGVGQIVRSIEAAGVYIPGGGATYPSSVLMNAVPATTCLVPRIAATTPARRDGTLAPAVLVALREAGVDEAHKIGGAAAIAALALGTESIARVDKIVGPGNRWVNEAKRQLWGRVGLDGYAGPSEVLVIADASARPEVAATDLLTQIEHAPDNLAFLVGVGSQVLAPILAAAERLIAASPRAETLCAAWKNSLAIETRDIEEALSFADAIAAEHVSLAVAEPEAYLLKLRHAGCVLLGETPESAGDFLAGPSHTLPTNGAARWQSPVNAFDFLRFQSVIGLDEAELKDLAPAIEAFGEMEGLPLHGGAGTMRLPADVIRNER